MTMDRVHIVSWLLTRKCNLKCSYCRIVRNYKDIPEVYPPISNYHKNEMSTEMVLKGLEGFKNHNPDSFHILYGGEPLLRKDLPEIVQFCNINSINYTIITNNSDDVQPMIENLLTKVNHVVGLTSSVDPIIFDKTASGDRLEKSIAGLKKLIDFKGIIKDLVAEITVDNETLPFLFPLVEKLTELGINSDITFIDIAKSKYYDFSNVTDKNLLVKKSPEVREQLEKIIDAGLNVHMAETLLPKIYTDLPSDMDCEIEKNIHNLTVDADGSIRLCLRIRGVDTPEKINLGNLFSKDWTLNPRLKPMLIRDKLHYCRLCNWTCMRMSQMISSHSEMSSDLIHSERRK
jgi:MoaA/NifB/PqqE/SkfB family radical SAM enzyme